MSKARYQKSIVEFEEFVQRLGVEKDFEGSFAVSTALLAILHICAFLGVFMTQVEPLSMLQIFAGILLIVTVISMGIYSGFYLYWTSGSRTSTTN